MVESSYPQRRVKGCMTSIFLIPAEQSPQSSRCRPTSDMMEDNTQPRPVVDNTDFDRSNTLDGNSRFDELVEASQQPKKSENKTNAPAGAEPLATSPNTKEETARRPADWSKGPFDDSDEQAKDPDLHKLFGLSPPPKRIRHEPQFSASRQISANRPYVPTSSCTVPSHAFLPSRLDQTGQTASNSSRSSPAAIEGTSPNLSAAELSRAEGLTKWLEDGQTASQSGEIVGSFFGSSSSALPSGQRRLASPSQATFTQSDQLAEYSQVFGSGTGPTSQLQADSQLPTTNVQVPQQAPQQPQPSKRRRQQQTHGTNEITSFPANWEKLPADLTLEQICWDYPNHINGPRLRRFVEAGWTANKIWDAMQDSAKVTSAKKRPWNKLEHRLLKAKKRMAEQESAEEEEEGSEEEDDADFSEGNMQGSSSSQLPQNIAGSGFPSPFPYDVRSTATTVRLMNPAPVAPFHAGSIHDGRIDEPYTSAPVQDHIGMVQSSFRAELGKQKRILSAMISYDDSGWPSRSQQERNRRCEVEWVRRVRRLERSFAADHDIDVDALELEQTSYGQMMKRLYRILKMSKVNSASSAANATSGGPTTSDDETRLLIFREKLEILRDWTAQWRQQLQEHAQRAPGVANTQKSRSVLPITGQNSRYGLGHPIAGLMTGYPQGPNPHPTANESSLYAQTHFALSGYGAAHAYANPQYGRAANPRDYYQQNRDTGTDQRHLPPFPPQLSYPMLGSANFGAGFLPAAHGGPYESRAASSFPPSGEPRVSAPEPTAPGATAPKAAAPEAASEFLYEDFLGPAVSWPDTALQDEK